MTDDEIIDAILRREGGYVNDPLDRGGCTNRGITLATLRAWRMRTTVTCEDVRLMPESEARAIYQAIYVKPFAAVDPALKPQLVDIAVLSGVARASALLAMAKDQADRPVHVQLVIERLKYYAKIVKADPSQAKFFSGWVNRATEFL